MAVAGAEPYRLPNNKIENPQRVENTQRPAASNTPMAAVTASTDSGDNPVEVPEPATMLLLGTGLVGLAALVRRHLTRRG